MEHVSSSPVEGDTVFTVLDWLWAEEPCVVTTVAVICFYPGSHPQSKDVHCVLSVHHLWMDGASSLMHGACVQTGSRAAGWDECGWRRWLAAAVLFWPFEARSSAGSHLVLSHYRFQQRSRVLQPHPLVSTGGFSDLILCADHLVAGLVERSHLNFRLEPIDIKQVKQELFILFYSQCFIIV